MLIVLHSFPTNISTGIQPEWTPAQKSFFSEALNNQNSMYLLAIYMWINGILGGYHYHELFKTKNRPMGRKSATIFVILVLLFGIFIYALFYTIWLLRDQIMTVSYFIHRQRFGKRIRDRFKNLNSQMPWKKK
jgi:hypothetical protein